MFSFQAGASIAKGLMPALGAPGTTALRVGLSALMLLAVRRPWRAMPSRRALPSVLLYGLSLGAMNLVFYSAIARIPLGVAVGLEFMGPLGVALAGSRRRIDFVWLALAVAGVGLLLPIAPGSRRLDPVGVGFALAAGAFWALYIVFGQRAARTHGPTASAWGLLIAACLVVPIGAVDAGRTLVAPSILPAGFAVAVLSSALPYSLEVVALTRLSTRAYGTLVSLEPALAALAGLVLLSERLTPSQWVGIVAVMIASAGALGRESGVAEVIEPA
jgi:inner membrane transporter RhtA